MKQREEIMKKEERKKLMDYKKALYIIDMNNGFVNFGAMANPLYNDLVPDQLRIIEKFRKENELVNFILEGHTEDAKEFKNYPKHCVLGTKEAEVIPEFTFEEKREDTKTYYKNSINGMFNSNLQEDIKQLKNLREAVFIGVCADLCVMDFARSYARFLDEMNKEAHLFVIKNAIDTFDAPNHNREYWMNIACQVMEQAGIEVVDSLNDLEIREKQLKLHE